MTNARRLALAIGAGLLVAAPLAACGGDDTEAAYCDAWSGVADSFEGLQDIDVVANGVDGVQSAVDAVGTSLEGLVAAGEEQLGGELDDFRASVEALLQTLTSPDLPVDRREQVREAIDETSAAWDALVDKAKADCPELTTA